MLTKMNILMFTLFVSILADQSAPEIKIEQGTLSGLISTDGSFYEYVGIPYASTNASTRFQAPIPSPSWPGVYQATKYYTCPQPRARDADEDCLKLNVYVPRNAEKPLPVMFYIHGGAFFEGSGGRLEHGPEFLIKHDVILVTINYRLGIFGFACLGIKEAPGNAGLKDQIAALRWVQKNIAAFGGDPNNVLLFGESAGAASTSILAASDVAKGLFHKAIPISGQGVATWSINRQPVFTASAVVKNFLDIDTTDPQEIYKILSDMSVEQLNDAHMPRPVIGKYSDTELIHIPCIEKEFPGEERVIYDIPYNMIKNNNNNIPMMLGTTDNEGIYLIPMFKDELEDRDKQYLFTTDVRIPEEKAEEINKALRDFYLGENGIMEEATILNVATLLGDLYFVIPAILETEILLKKNSTVYNFSFNYVGGRNFVKYYMTAGFGAHVPGAAHADTNFYLFDSVLYPDPPNERDQRIIDIMTTLWTNFAKYGNPTPDNELSFQWLPSVEDNIRYLNINDNFEMGPKPNKEAYQLWKPIYDKYRITDKNQILNNFGGNLLQPHLVIILIMCLNILRLTII